MPPKKQSPDKPPKLRHLLTIPDDEQFAKAVFHVISLVVGKNYGSKSFKSPHVLFPIEAAVDWPPPLEELWFWLTQTSERGQPAKIKIAAVRCYIARKETTWTWAHIHQLFGDKSASQQSLEETERKFRQLIEGQCKMDLWAETCGLPPLP